MMPDRETPSLPAMSAEEKVLPPKSNDASIPSTQLEESLHNAGQKHPPSVSPNPEPDRSRTTSIAEKSSNTSKLANQESAPPSNSTLVAETAAASRPATGQENRVPPNKTQMAVNPSPGSATAIVHLKVLKASICSAINDRMPAGTGTSFPPTVQRVYVWNQIEAKQIPSKIRHIYYFKGQKISDVTLDIRSPNWRTWSYKRISNIRYRGQWRVDIATAGGKVLRRLYFQIK